MQERTTKRLEEEITILKNQYKEAISSMNKEKILNFWNKLTEETENAYTKERKWRHLDRWEKMDRIKIGNYLII